MLVVFLVPRREPLCIKQKNPKMSTSPFDDNDRSLQRALLWYFFEEKKRGQQKTNGTKDRSSQKQKRKTIKCCGRKMYTHNLKRHQKSAKHKRHQDSAELKRRVVLVIDSSDDDDGDDGDDDDGDDGDDGEKRGEGSSRDSICLSFNRKRKRQVNMDDSSHAEQMPSSSSSSKLNTAQAHGEESSLSSILSPSTRQQGRESDARKEDVKDEDKDLCQICFEAKKDTILLPCGHYFYCTDCVEKLAHPDVCPYCREKINTKHKVYS